MRIQFLLLSAVLFSFDACTEPLPIDSSSTTDSEGDSIVTPRSPRLAIAVHPTRIRRAVARPVDVEVLPQDSSTPLQIATTNQEAPGIPGYYFNGLFFRNNSPSIMLEPPRISGEVPIFASALRTDQAALDADLSYWRYDSSHNMQKMARVGDLAVATEEGTTYTALSDLRAGINGRAFFFAQVAGPNVVPVHQSTGLWRVGTNATELMYRRGDIAPGSYAIGTNHEGRFMASSDTYDLDGTAGSDFAMKPWIGTYSDEQSLFPGNWGIWQRTPTGFQISIWSYGYAMGFSGLNMQGDLPYMSVSRSGRGASFGRVSGPSIQSVLVNGISVTNDQVIWKTGPFVAVPTVRSGDPAPDTGTGIVFRNFQAATPAVNARGDFAFSAYLAGPGITSYTQSIASGLWRYSAADNETRLFVRGGDPAPEAGTGIQFGGNFSNVAPTNLGIMENGNIVFTAGLSGTGINLGNYASLWIKSPSTGQKTMIARAGVPTSALDENLRISSSSFPTQLRVVGNETVLFFCKLVGTSAGIVTTANDDALFSYDSIHGLRLLLREGSEIDGYILKSFGPSGSDLQLRRTGFGLMKANFSPASNPTAAPKAGLAGISPVAGARVLVVAGQDINLGNGITKNILTMNSADTDAVSDGGKAVVAVKYAPSNIKDEAVLTYLIPN